MSNDKIITFNKNDFTDFRDWIDLNLDAITWQRRYESDFEQMWSLIFLENINFNQVILRLNYVLDQSTIGPFKSWFSWLTEKFIVYSFVYKGASIFELSKQGNLQLSKVSRILRNFFIEKHPHLDDYFSVVFQVGNVASENLYLTFDKISSDRKITNDFIGTHEDDIMPMMEITLYDEWKDFLKKIKKGFYKADFNPSTLKVKSSLKKQFVFIREIVLLVVIGIIIIGGIRYVNHWYENYLADKISIYEPQFRWLDKNLKFKPIEKVTTTNLKIDLDNTDIKEEIEEKSRIEEGRTFETESEVVLSSLDTLPKDFDIAGLEQSEYEELKKGGYRDTRFGNKKVYRVMMRSINALSSSSQLNNLINQYGAIKVDNVMPGTTVPGGFYYNLYVPRDTLKEFITRVMKVDEAILYEHRTRGVNPPGKNKVFIWIKTI